MALTPDSDTKAITDGEGAVAAARGCSKPPPADVQMRARRVGGWTRFWYVTTADANRSGKTGGWVWIVEAATGRVFRVSADQYPARACEDVARTLATKTTAGHRENQ